MYKFDSNDIISRMRDELELSLRSDVGNSRDTYYFTTYYYYLGSVL